MGRRRLQHKFPRLTAIRRFEKAALAPIGPEMAACGDVCDFWLRRMNDNSPDGAALLQPDILPIFTPVGGTINTVPPARGVAIVRFARAHPDHIGIGRRECNGAD